MTDNIEEKLEALAKLQTLDSKLDIIHTLRGSLPDEVEDLEDDVVGLQTRLQKINDDIKLLDLEITKRKGIMKDYSDQIRKYETQLNTVKNNREFEALSKEIEFANLEILTSDKKIKGIQEQIAQKNQLLSDTNGQIEEKKTELDVKQKELEAIVKETEEEEKKLHDASKKAGSKVDARVLRHYQKIRKNMRNGLAVVSTDRDACGGCFAIIPPQMHLELRHRKKLLVCENCGRILVDVSFFEGSKKEVQNA